MGQVELLLEMKGVGMVRKVVSLFQGALSVDQYPM